MAKQWLKDAIVEYLKNNPNKHLDSVDIVRYFKLRADITTDAIFDLKQEGKIIHHSFGISTWYTVA